MFGAAQPNAFGAEVAGLAGVARAISVGAHPHAARFVRPAHECFKGAGELGGTHFSAPCIDAPSAAIDGNGIALPEGARSYPHDAGVGIDFERACARDTRPAHAARHNCGVAGHAAARRQYANGCVHAMHVFGARLSANQDDIFALGFQGFGHFRMKSDLARRRTRRRWQTGCDQIMGDGGIDSGMQQLIELRWINAQDGLVFRYQTFARHIDSDFHGGFG